MREQIRKESFILIGYLYEIIGKSMCDSHAFSVLRGEKLNGKKQSDVS